VGDHDVRIRDELRERCAIDVATFDHRVRNAGQGGDGRLNWGRRLLECLEGVGDRRDPVVGVAELDGGDFQDLVARDVEAGCFSDDHPNPIGCGARLGSPWDQAAQDFVVAGASSVRAIDSVVSASSGRADFVGLGTSGAALTRGFVGCLQGRPNGTLDGLNMVVRSISSGSH